MPNSQQSAHDRGVLGEELACEYLAKKGYSIIERNYRIRGGEIDIITRDGKDIVFVEVKLRNSTRFGYPEESVSYTKKKRVARVIKSFLHSTGARYSCVRFDIIAIVQDVSGTKMNHIEDVELPANIC